MSAHVIETNEDISKDIFEEEKNLFEVESNALYQKVIGSKGLQTIPSKNLTIINKNDSIKTKVTQITNLLRSQTEPLLIAGKSNAISKMLTISELLKSTIRNDHPTVRLKQYNKLTKQSSLHNPNYKQTNKTVKQRNNVDNFMNDAGIHGHKIYQLPILYILFVPKEDSSLELSGWSHQDN
ncbi:uncharacterized protein AC631_01661 [Debaryomyces fabryi]|uniref:DNA/RNA-binding protein Alba-like domain-containing protein n=1 Tax=Debaryomyces fabryi TaxID=58627 RepID=A0A0V1Q2A8_9ASCO|nr:uncharacterized protein AC631_01661 [Debaryomyces fabryi]KSA02578.1 hypothetical protein AC631_01661 [Debaryomyces fabryi]CUM55934.1 unnamed protein product [Debaryomyces fabryi]